jgi:subtilisin family serine protease
MSEFQRIVRRLSAATASVALVAVVLATGAQARVVVGYESGVSAAQRAEIVESAGGQRGRSVVGLQADRVEPAAGSDEVTLLTRLKLDRRVRYAEHDAQIDASGSPRYPNDPSFPSQWGLSNSADHDIDAPPGWESKTSCSKVAILDTGIDVNHPDLVSNLWHNSGEKANNGEDDDKNGYVDDYYGVNVRIGSGSGIDNDGHGTHIAGIIGASANNAVGISGVCWKGSLMSVKFMSFFGVGSTSDAAEGIRYAVKMGARVINASFGSSSASSTLHDAIAYAKSKGALIVVAAGNDHVNIDKKPSYPASYTDGNILTVAASDANDKLASFSNYGESSVDVAAPGVDIFSTFPGGRYAEMSGTSMATPYVAGIAGLLKAKNSDTDYGDWKYAIRKKVDKPSALKHKVVYDGRANLNKAIDYIAGL